MRLSFENRRRIVVWLLLAAVMAGASLHRADRFLDRPFYQPESDTGFFYTEEAFQYRYARMAANDEAVPLFDKKAQWPEGLAPFRELTLFQEHLHGLAFRLFSSFSSPVSPHVFLSWFVSFFSSLAVLALFLGARALGADGWTALFCSALYAFTGAAFARLRFYELEGTAFPLMTLSLAACLYALRRPRQAFLFAVISGGLLAVALISWHFTRFYLLIFWTAMAGAFLFAGGSRPRAVVAGVVLLFAAVAGLLSPVMRSSGLLFSPAMMAGGVVVIGLYYDDKHGLGFLSRLAWLTAGAVAIGIVFSFGGEEHAYGHVWDLLKYKLSNFLIKPSDPAALPFAGRILWNGPFNTPAPGFLLYRYGLLLPLVLVALFRFAGQKRHTAAFEDVMVILMAVMFLAANIMVQRLTIFGAFFSGLTVVYLFSPRPESPPATTAGELYPFSFPKRFRLSWLVLAACLIFQIREALLCDRTLFAAAAGRLFPDHSPARVSPDTEDGLDLLAWIRANTGQDAVFLSNQGNSPSILTYTGRAINLHPKLETKGLRKKYETALLALFGEDEEALYRVFDDFQTDYYLYPVCNLLQADRDGERYLAGVARVTRGSLTYRLHFEPDGFRRLQLVYRNRYFQIYRVVDEKRQEVSGPGYVAPYFPVYDPALFTAADGPDSFDDTRVDAVLERIDYAIRTMDQAGEWLSRGDRRMTAGLIRKALTVGLPDGRVYSRAADYMVRLGNPDQAFAYIRSALACDPENSQFEKQLARIHVIRNEPDRALSVLTAISRKWPEDAIVYNDTGVILWKKKQFAAARDNFLRALALDPGCGQARHNLAVLEKQQQP